jgi:tRNA-splicing ligase RtcB
VGEIEEVNESRGIYATRAKRYTSCCTRDRVAWGNRFGTFFIELAKSDMRQWMINLPDQDLAYLPQGTAHFEDYVRAVHWAQDYALANRELMMRNMIAAVQGSGDVPAFAANVEVVS